MFETYLFDGVDVKTSARLLRTWDTSLASAELRGDDLVVVDADGAAWLDERPFDAYALNLGLTLRGGTDGGFNDARRALTRMVKPASTVVLTRRMSFSTGDETHTTLARYQTGLQPQMVGMTDGDLTLVMKILDGLWWGTATTIAPGTVTILGDVRTRRMTITFTGGTDPTLTNTTTGDEVSWTGTVGGTPVVIDNETLTAMHGGTNVSGALEHIRTFPMTLSPEHGPNTLVLTGGGTASISYSPAYQ